jgi:hypothetical protein
MPNYPFNFPTQTLTPLAASGNTNPITLKNRSVNAAAVFHIKFTLGSLTNATFTVQQQNPDGATWETLSGSQYTTGTVTASGGWAIAVGPGITQPVRLAYTTTGTTTGSQVVLDVSCQQA